MQAALHQHAGAAQVQGLLDLGENGLVIVDVAFGVAHGPVEGAKAAIFRTEIGVIDVAIDNVGNHAFGMVLLAQGIGGHANTDQVVGTEKVQGFVCTEIIMSRCDQAVMLRTCAWRLCAKT